MKKIRAILFVLVMVLFGLCYVPNNAQAGSGTDTIHEDYYIAHPISFSSGDSIEISYTMSVTEGPSIDVYMVDSQNYKYFQDGKSFDYYIAASDENTKYASNQITLQEHDTYYLIFDNTDVGTDPPWNMVDDVAYVSYTINSAAIYSDEGGGGGIELLSLIIPLGIIVIIIVVVIGLIAWALGRKKKETYPYPHHVPYQQPQPNQAPQADAQPPQQLQSKPHQKQCQSCGRLIPPDSIICPYCGYRL